MCAHQKQFTGQTEQSETGCLFVVATPIGNLGDMTHRAIETLQQVERIYCEDTRMSGKLMQHYGIATKLESYHEHNAAQVRPKILQQLASGASLALISDAGTPLISDPGYKLVSEILDAGHQVIPLPGACAAIAALCASGLPSDQFHFAGFLAPKGKAREQLLETLSQTEGTLILYETAPKLLKTLRELETKLGDRKTVIMREITKRFEERIAGNLSKLCDQIQKNEITLKGEIVLLIAPAEETAAAQDWEALLKAALKHVSVKDAAAIVASQTGEKKQTIYQRALELKDAG